MTAYYKDSTIQDLEKLLSQAKGLHSRFEPIWYLNLAYFGGDQWVFWNRGRLDRPRLDPWRVTLTDNRMIGIIRTELAKMTKQKPAFQVVPVTGDDSDLQASLTGEKVLDYLWRHLKLRERLYDALLWARTTGAGFWKIYWDSAKGKKINIVTDQEGAPVMHSLTGAPMQPEHFGGEMPEGLQTKMIATGDVMVEVVSPFEFFPDPIPNRLSECEWVIQVSVKSPEWVKAHFGQEVEPDTDVAPGPAESRLFPTFQMGGTSGFKGVKVHEYWCKPNSVHINGRRACWARGKMLCEEDNPYKRLPYVMFRGIPYPGRFWPTSIAEQLRGPQTELNKAKSQMTENAQRIGNPALLASRQANINYQGTPGERIDFDDTVPNAIPSYLQPPQMPAYVDKQQDRIEQSIQEISGQHEVSNAQVPAGVKAASAINLLQEADDTRLGPAIYEMEDVLGDAGGCLLKLVAQYWNDERTIMIAGEDHAWDVMNFKGAALKENTHVEVQAGSAFPKSKAAKQAAMQDILGLVVQYGMEIDPRQLRKFLSDYEAGGLERLLGQLTATEAQVNRENGQLIQGQPLQINAYDEHQMHIDGHTEFQRGPTYKLCGPEIEGVWEAHIMEHREQVQREAEAAQQQQMMMQGPQQSPNGKPEGPSSAEQIAAEGGTHVKTETQVGNTKTTKTKAE